jgi:hypothetical protein
MTTNGMTLRTKTVRALALLGAVGLAAALASATAAEAAQAGKQGKHVKRSAPAATATADRSRYWGRNLVQPGPLYNGPDYLGDDPDPNIRSQILRDLTGRYGGID